MRAGLERFFSFLSPKHRIGGRVGGVLELLLLCSQSLTARMKLWGGLFSSSSSSLLPFLLPLFLLPLHHLWLKFVGICWEGGTTWGRGLEPPWIRPCLETP